ncbi:carboxypeptidase Y-deficient, partial [Nowakowskiella sp. JEL0078]
MNEGRSFNTRLQQRQIPNRPASSSSSYSSSHSNSFPNNDTSSRVAAWNSLPESIAPNSEFAPLSCPICFDEMLTLGMLNQHIDDQHSEESDDAKNVLLDWFKKTQKTILDPLSKAARRTEAGLSNLNLERINAVVKGETPFGLNQNMPARILNFGEDEEADFDRMITKNHWQHEAGNDICSYNSCGKSLGLRSGKNNCRKCGRLYCEEHCRLQMKLSIDARYDPDHGYWVRVCLPCFTGRDGFLDTHGVSRSRTQTYLRIRKSKIDQVLLEANKLEKRLERVSVPFIFTLTVTNDTFTLNQSNRNSVGSISKSKRALEQSVVTWEDEKVKTNCPICSLLFNSLTKRKHHCRLCGRVICDLDSSHIPLQPVDASNNLYLHVDVVLTRRDNAIELSKVPASIKLYQ